MIELDAIEARILGVLIEKEITTPDQYPLSLKAVTVACNQKSNREPVMSLSEVDVQNGIDTLSSKNLVSEVVFGSRTIKYKHRFSNTEFSELKLNSKQIGVLCVMLLRGPQTPGELRTRTQRICDFTDVQVVDEVLESLATYSKGALVVKLGREPGRRESRFAHLFSGTPEVSSVVQTAESVMMGPSQEERIKTLEQELSDLRKDFDELRDQWDELNA